MGYLILFLLVNFWLIQSMLRNPVDRHELVRQDVEQVRCFVSPSLFCKLWCCLFIWISWCSQVVCSVCDTEQPVWNARFVVNRAPFKWTFWLRIWNLCKFAFFFQVDQVCTNCGVRMGEYFCKICKFYDDDVINFSRVMLLRSLLLEVVA